MTILELVHDIHLKTGLFDPDKTRINHVNSSWALLQCPFHKGGKERNPSFSLNTVDGYYKCFACGKFGNITELSQLYNIDFTLESANGRGVNLVVTDKETEVVDYPGFDEDWIAELTANAYPDQFLERGISEETLRQYRVCHDTDSNCIVFPVYQANGRPGYVFKRSAINKRFYTQSNVRLLLYGIDKAYNRQREELFITEGPIDALSLIDMGYNAVACFGLGSVVQMRDVLKLGNRKVVLAFDNDKAGHEASIKWFSFLSRNCDKGLHRLQYPDSNIKDPNDLLKEYGRRCDLKYGRCEDLLFKKVRQRR